MEGLYGGARLNSLLRDTDLSPRHVQQLLKQGGLDQTVHLQDTPNYALPVDLLEHIPSRQTHGYLHNKKANEIMQLINVLSDLAPEEVPEDTQFLLEINFSELSSYHLETTADVAEWLDRCLK